MQKKKLYIVRHSQSQFNVEGRIGGNAPLTALGKKQAEQMAHLLSELDVDVIYHSELFRSKETAKCIAHFHPNASFIQDARLNEITQGVMDNMTYDDVTRLYPKLHKQRQLNKYNFAFPQGESYAHVTTRVVPFVDLLLSKTKNTVVVGHKAIIRSILGYLMHTEHTRIPHLEVRHDVIFEFDLNTRELQQISGSQVHLQIN
jgi:broad specificity phosphatase PhoE